MGTWAQVSRIVGLHLSPRSEIPLHQCWYVGRRGLGVAVVGWIPRIEDRPSHREPSSTLHYEGGLTESL